MLRGSPAEITPELLAELARLGHGDLVAVVDRNFPAYSQGAPVAVLAGIDAPSALRAIWSLAPIDAFADVPVRVMAQDSGERSAIHDEVVALSESVARSGSGVGTVDRQDYYRAAKRCALIVKTSDDRPYACALFAFGVL